MRQVHGTLHLTRCHQCQVPQGLSRNKPDPNPVADPTHHSNTYRTTYPYLTLVVGTTQSLGSLSKISPEVLFLPIINYLMIWSCLTQKNEKKIFFFKSESTTATSMSLEPCQKVVVAVFDVAE